MNKTTYLVSAILFFFLISCGGGGGGEGAGPNVPPRQPQNLVSINGNEQVRLSWDNVDGAMEYNVYWSTKSGGVKTTGTKVAKATNPYYHGNLTNDTIYYYVVTATNQYGESIESFEVSAIPSQHSAPLPPKEIVVVGFDGRNIVRWTGVETAGTNTSYNIYWSTLPGVKKSVGTKISDAVSPYTHTNLINGVTYYYVVTGVNEYGEGKESQEVSTKPDKGKTPPPPAGVKAVSGDREAVISWDPIPEDPTSTIHTIYNIYWSTSSDISSSDGTKISNVKSPYTHKGLSQGNTYYYVVTAQNGYGESEDSGKVSVTIDDTRQDICVSLGDSITVGDRASSYAKSYVPLLSARWGKAVLNGGVPGAYSSYGSAVIDSILYDYNPRYITIYYGTNDAGFISPDETISYLRYMIGRAKENGTVPVVATLGPCFDEWAWRQPYVLDLSQRIRQLAASEGIACADIDAALGWNRGYMADSLHPNDEGHRIIAETFYGALK